MKLSARAVSLVCGVVAALVGLVAQWASRRPSFHPSLLLNIFDGGAIAGFVREADPGFRFVGGLEHYDGTYFYAMARDPFALGQAHELIDLAAYRYGHPLYSWLAGLLSFGQPRLLPWVFWLLSLASMFAAGYLLSHLVRRLGGSPWWGLAVAASPGLLFSASTALTEPLQVALVAAVALLWLRERPNPWLLGLAMVAMCLTKEQLALVPIALLVDLGIKVARGRPAGWGRLGAVLAGPIALGAWLVFVRGQFTAEQLRYDDGNVGAPLLGWLDTFAKAGTLRATDFHGEQIGSTVTSGLIATAVVLAVASVVALLRRDAFSWVVLLQAGLVMCLGWRTLLYPHEMFRLPSVALLLTLALLGAHLGRPRATPAEVADEDATTGDATTEDSTTEDAQLASAPSVMATPAAAHGATAYQGRYARRAVEPEPEAQRTNTGSSEDDNSGS